MSDLDILIKKNPLVLDLVRRFDLITIPKKESLDSKVSNRVRSLITKLAAQYQ